MKFAAASEGLDDKDDGDNSRPNKQQGILIRREGLEGTASEKDESGSRQSSNSPRVRVDARDHLYGEGGLGSWR